MCWYECVLVHCFLPHTLLFHVTGPVCEMGSKIFLHSYSLWQSPLYEVHVGSQGHAKCCYFGTESSESCGKPFCEMHVIFLLDLTSIRLVCRHLGIRRIDPRVFKPQSVKPQSVDLAQSPPRDTFSLLILCLHLSLSLLPPTLLVFPPPAPPELRAKPRVLCLLDKRSPTEPP